jgi:hypothetical protein
MTQNIEQAFRQVAFDAGQVQAVLQREVPLLCSDWGARDEDALVHSHGMNFLGALGRAAGFVGLVEYPVPHAERWPGKVVRVDAAWIDSAERRPRLLGEFERFTTEADAQGKLANLFVAAHAFSAPPELLVLCLWSLDGTSIGIGPYRPGASLNVAGGPPVTCPTGAKGIVVHAVFGRQKDLYHFIKFRGLA